MSENSMYRQITKLINVGYPMYIGIGFLAVPVYLIFKIAFEVLTIGSERIWAMSISEASILLVLLSITTGLGILFIKIAGEAQKEK